MADTNLRWSDLSPEQGIARALEHAGDRPDETDDATRQEMQNRKRRWSERFADACAVAVADQLHRAPLRGKTISPAGIGDGTERLTPLGGTSQKRIDVTVTDPVLGLEVGVSLKGLNFRDAGSRNFDKNLTGRLYELGDEVRMVHEHLPHAFMVGLFFLPMDSVSDKNTGASSYAKTLLYLRARSGRLDPSLPAHAPRCDMGFVGLYTLGEEQEGFPPAIARFQDVRSNPPRRGRPRVEDTLSLSEMADRIVAEATHAGDTDQWGEAEED